MDSIIANNLALVREKIGRAEIEAGFAPGTVTLVGVTKNRTVLEIENAICEGLTDIGENRLQEAAKKLPQIRQPVTKHFVGHLQRNKVKDVLELFNLTQSIDSERLALEVDKRAKLRGTKAKILMQVNTSVEESKFGIEPERAEQLYEVIVGCENLELLGLMTIGLFSSDTAAVAVCFRKLRKLFEKFSSLPASNCRMEILSMGMSSDYEIAIAEGANMVRVGTAIFGPRFS